MRSGSPDVINGHRFQELTQAEKLDRIRKSPPWNPDFEVTSTDWVLTRLDSVVEAITANVNEQVTAGVMLDQTQLPATDRQLVEGELHELDPLVRGRSACCPGGVRCIGGASSSRALAWNRRTCRLECGVRRRTGRVSKGDPHAAVAGCGRVPTRGTGADRPVVVTKAL